MNLRQTIALLLWPLGLFGLSAGWSLIEHGSFTIAVDYFDTAHYHAIAASGYAVPTDAAFFPAFPYIWRWLAFPAWAMGLVNLLIWLVGLGFISMAYHVQRRAIVMAALVPQVLFFAIPYSESLFFLAGVCIVAGLARQQRGLIYAGIFFAALVRPTAAVLIPALFIARLLSGVKWRQSVKISLIEAFVGLAGVCTVFGIQYLDTGNWGSFFAAQATWGNQLGWPRLPFQSWGGDLITLIDAMALFVGLLAGRTLWRTRRGGIAQLHVVERFGLAGLFITALLVLFTRGGDLFSLNRFIFATIFFPLALSAWSRIAFRVKELFVIWLVWGIFSLSIRSYVHIEYFLMCMGTGALIMLVLYALRHKSLRTVTYLILLVASAALFVYYYQAGRWIA